MPKKIKFKSYFSKTKVPRATSRSTCCDLFSCEKKIIRPFSQDLIKTIKTNTKTNSSNCS